MIKICAWCKKYLGQDDREPVDLITHSICQDCRDKYFPTSAAKVPSGTVHKGAYRGRNYTLEEVGKELGVTKQRVMQIEKSALKKCRAGFERLEF